MRPGVKWLIPLVLILIVLAVYFWPAPHKSFDALFAPVDTETATSLRAFREEHRLEQLEVSGVTWNYVALGQGEKTILFLHGMTGAYDIWWQQIEAFQERYRIISVTYPAVDSLERLSQGIVAILDREEAEKVSVVGSSLGGYLTQYIVAARPQRVSRALFANTFPPNDRLAEENRTIGAALPFLPEWLVLNVLRGTFADTAYPASGFNELTLAYLREQSYGRMSKAQVLARYRCVIDTFAPASPEELGIPVTIIEADNDPLVDEILREKLKSTYPSAEVNTLHNVGHFPYLSHPQEYNRLLEGFLEQQAFD